MAYLAMHYFRINPNRTGRYAVTASSAGLYGVPDLPLYSATKFGCVGLVRSLGTDRRAQREDMTFNAICPGWVETGLTPPHMVKLFRKNWPEIITPMSTVMKAYDMILESKITGQAVECTEDLIQPRPTLEVLP